MDKGRGSGSDNDSDSSFAEDVEDVSLVLRGLGAEDDSDDEDLAADWFYKDMQEERIMSHSHAWLVEKGVLSYRGGQAFNMWLIIMWAAVFFHDGLVFPAAVACLPGLIEMTSLCLILVSMSTMALFFGMRRLVGSSRVFKSFYEYGFNEIKADKRWSQKFHPPWYAVAFDYVRLLGFGLLPFIALEAWRGQFSPLGWLVVANGMVQPWMGSLVVPEINLVLFLGQAPAKNMLRALQKGAKFRDSGRAEASSFWQRALRSFQVLEVHMRSYYQDATMMIVPALCTLSLLFLGCVSLVNGACSRLSSSVIFDASLALLGLFGCSLTGATFVGVLWELVAATRLCSGAYTYMEPPTILSTAYRTMGSEDMTEDEKRDLDRFIHYVSNANVGARLFDVPVTLSILLQLTAGVSVFTWLVIKLTEKMESRLKESIL